MFRLLLLINSYVHTFYAKSAPDPVFQACLVTVLLFFFNILEILLVITGISGVSFRELVLGGRVLTGTFEHAILVIPLLLGLAVLNYGLVYHRNKHHDYFVRLSHQGEYIRHRDFYVFWLYFLLTVMPVAWWVIQRITDMPRG
ncbi:hypothetical protein D0N36_14425 [Hymenobacter lapidiphilus]|uniref:hypothetical protein n=1 Tax=Hymenobacter sp. CCM 8763 TaxID=2303334 RepID=UPI000E353BE4|nr:hypothetical protein [Hymenobacter sp. CCM 8763]RFP64381.1 hypothetical protein D0N36_14425 [Hymenobacter sp. CCM 8763]